MKKFYILLVALFVVNGAMAQWVQQNSGTTNTINSVYFTDVNTGYAVGDSGTILKTIDGGNSWIGLSSGTLNNLYSVHFPVEFTGYVVGDGIILKTTDGGINWGDSIGNFGLYSVYFTNVDTGYAVGGVWYYDYMIKTTDGGVNWIGLYHTSYPFFELRSVYFLNASVGFTVGVSKILNTVDGGANWTYRAVPNDGILNCVFFPSTNIGYAVGYNSYNDGIVIKTNSEGMNWAIQKLCVDTIFNSVFFTDENLGHTVGNNGIILKTTDGGVKWRTENYGTTADFHSVYFTSTDTGYIVGDSGIILKTTQGGYPVGSNDLSPKYNTLQMYPNPTSTTITIETTAKGQISIFNLNGQELLQQEITEPNITIDINTFPSGIYFVKLTGKELCRIGKIIKQ